MWWKSLGAHWTNRSYTLRGLLLVVIVATLAYVLSGLIEWAIGPMGRPQMVGVAPVEPTPLERFADSSWQFVLAHEFTLVGLLISLLVGHCLWEVINYYLEWGVPNSNVKHPKESWRFILGAAGLLVSVCMLLAWIAPVS